MLQPPPLFPPRWIDAGKTTPSNSNTIVALEPRDGTFIGEAGRIDSTFVWSIAYSAHTTYRHIDIAWIDRAGNSAFCFLARVHLDLLAMASFPDLETVRIYPIHSDAREMWTTTDRQTACGSPHMAPVRPSVGVDRCFEQSSIV